MADAKRFMLEDGRWAERRVVENVKDCEGEKVTELHAEEVRPLYLTERLVEKSKPFVYEKVHEVLDKDGNVIEQKVEAIDPTSQMKVQAHILSATSVPTEEKPRYVTSDELLDAVAAVVQKVCGGDNDNVDRTNYYNDKEVPVNNLKLGKLDALKETAAANDTTNTLGLFEKGCIALSVILGGALLYVNFLAG